MQAAANFAWANRQALTGLAREVFGAVLGLGRGRHSPQGGQVPTPLRYKRLTFPSGKEHIIQGLLQPCGAGPRWPAPALFCVSRAKSIPAPSLSGRPPAVSS
ncbi:MAG: hypothetical protein COT18_05605 [Elusimicrobia bacterium CG08_land_8_20_14_0_20_59_10]|nr:MAG: hypothetical protein COT18_05605 [Elusimicrobia bacterium CG08_land_8_20_14_0_20_59_10]